LSDESRSGSSPASPGTLPAWQRSGTLYVIGIDGMAPHVVAAMGRRELPNLHRLADEGCHGPLKTIWPTNSSLLWTTIATGRHHRDHGIDDFWYYRLGRRKLGQTTVRKGPRWRKLLLRVLGRLGLAPMQSFDGRDLRVNTFWEIVALTGARVGVVNWWHTWPAVPLSDFVVSDRLAYWREVTDIAHTPAARRLVSPPELLDAVRELLIAPQNVTLPEMAQYVRLPDDELEEFMTADFEMNELRGELRFLISADRSCSNILHHCLDEFPGAQVVAAYLRAPDIAQHCAFRFSRWADRSHATARERERLGQAVPQAYRLADELLGRVLERMAPADSILVLSDHGVTYIDERRGYGHRYGEPPGVLYARGKEFRRGQEISGASIYDVTPTVLRVCGLPAERAMQGRSLEELLTKEFRRDHPPPRPVESYGPRRPPDDDATQPSQVTRDIKKHLQGLGYLD